MTIVCVTREARQGWTVHRGAQLSHLMAIGAVLVFALEGLWGGRLCVDRSWAKDDRVDGEPNGEEHPRPLPRDCAVSGPKGAPLRPGGRPFQPPGWLGLTAREHDGSRRSPASSPGRPEDPLDAPGHDPGQCSNPDHREEDDKGNAEERCRNQEPHGLEWSPPLG